MANLFDQYERDTQKSAYIGGGTRVFRPELSTSGYIRASFDDDEGIFRKVKVDFRPPDVVTHMVVRNNHLVLAMVNKVLFRMDLRKPDQPDEVDISDKAIGLKIHRLFLDPFGQHLIVSLTAKNNDPNVNIVYLLRNAKKPKLSSKMKGHVVTAVAWNPYNSKDNATGPILLGTSKGLIFETELTMGDDWNLFQSNIEIYWKQVFDISCGNAITSIEFYKNPLTENKYFVLATTKSRLYQFLGSIPAGAEAPILHHIFTNYPILSKQFVEIPRDLENSQLQFYSNPPNSVPKTFAWMTGAGILHGAIDCSGDAVHDSVTRDTKFIPYPAEEGERVRPLAIALTEFHVVILFSDRLKVICLLNEQLVYQDIFVETYGRMLGLLKDSLKDKIYSFSERAVFSYKVTNESRNVWEIYLERGDFVTALELCQNNPVNVDKVRSCLAEDCFKKGQYIESARLYAMTQTSFEEVTLKFLALDQQTALKTFLIHKMGSLKAQDKTQLTMIVAWVVELYLNKLGSIRDSGDKQSASYTELRNEFRVFLEMPRVMECINNNRGTIYGLISSHGDQESLVHVTALMKDYDRVIRYHIHNGQFSEALKTLQKQKNVDLFYQYSPILMQACPHETVNMWISQARKLNPTRLIPALLQCDHNKTNTQENEALRYLEFCIQTLDNKNTSIHNYLLSLYARHNPDKLMAYLDVQGLDAAYICYDLKYALRLCSEYKHTKACVLIYAAMELYEEAVDLALQVDVDLAKQNADRPEDNNELKKKLWLKIARHVVKEENNIKRAMEFLQECDLIKIEDILPFFPDFVTIDHFKDAICTSLQEYNQHIDGLQEEMKEATQSAQEIRLEIQAFRNRFTLVRGIDKCAICLYPLVTRGFYLFSCEHKFHADCLMAEVTPHLIGAKRHRIAEIRQQMTQLNREENAGGPSSATKSVVLLNSQRDQLKIELDDLIAAECLYCGDIMIKCIDTPFIDPDDYDEETKGWD